MEIDSIKTDTFLKGLEDQRKSSILEITTLLRLQSNRNAIDAVSSYLLEKTDRPLFVTGDCGGGKDHLVHRLSYFSGLKTIHIPTLRMLQLLKKMNMSIEEIDVLGLADQYSVFHLDSIQVVEKFTSPKAWLLFVNELSKTGCKTIITANQIFLKNQTSDDYIHAHIASMTEADKLLVSHFYFLHEFGYLPQSEEDLQTCLEIAGKQSQSCRGIVGDMRKVRMTKMIKSRVSARESRNNK